MPRRDTAFIEPSCTSSRLWLTRGHWSALEQLVEFWNQYVEHRLESHDRWNDDHGDQQHDHGVTEFPLFEQLSRLLSSVLLDQLRATFVCHQSLHALT